MLHRTYFTKHVMIVLHLYNFATKNKNLKKLEHFILLVELFALSTGENSYDFMARNFNYRLSPLGEKKNSYSEKDYRSSC